MNKLESKYFNTALRMDAAMLSLLEEKDVAYITVKEICKRAGVNRSTFYLHYENIGDLLTECLKNTEQQFSASFEHSQEELARNIESLPLEKLIFVNHEYLMPYLDFIKENKSVYVAAHKNPACLETNTQFSRMSQTILKPILSRFGIPTQEHHYWIAYYIRGCTAIINEWIASDFKEDASTIADIMIQCVKPYKDINEKTNQAQP